MRLSLLIGVASLASLVLADETDIDRAVQANLGLRLVYDSNLYDSNTSKNETWIGIITPAILITSAPAQQRFALVYEGEYGYFSEDSADNYADHALIGGAQLQIGSRSELDLSLATEKKHQDRGSFQTEGIDPSSPSFPAEADEFDQHKWAGNFRYGAEGSRGRLRMSVGGSQREYTNNLGRTRFFDFETLYGGAGISLSFHQRTAIVLDTRFTEIRYDTVRPGEPSLDSQDWRFLAGLTWEATAKTQGSVRVGLQQRRFDDPARGTSSNPSWEIDVRWLPLDYSYIDFIASRLNEETFAEGSFIDTTSYRVAWTHEWIRGWESNISLLRSDSRFVGSLRDEDFSEFRFSLRYPQSRLITWQAGYSHRSRDSNLTNLVFDGDMFSIGVSIGN